MTAKAFPHLFSPLTVAGREIKNRILSTGHDTNLPSDGAVNDALVAYHQARAKGGAGLIVAQVAGVHESARYTSHMLMATEEDCIPGFRRLAQSCHAEDCRLYGQLFHPGREIMESGDGALPVAYAPSAVPSERFHVVPRPLDLALIEEIVAGYGTAARLMAEAGLDGVEIVASHGYLPAQFLSPRTNLREDAYGGSFEGRLRFLEEILAAIRAETNGEIAVGLRISGDGKDPEGLEENESLAAIEALAPSLDYVNVIAGSSASLGGAIHIVPPMAIETGYLAPFAAQVKAKVAIPVFVAGRINQPQTAEGILATGQADMCGMTRAMICDPEMPNKAQRGETEDIRACIACNQACIGHFHLGYPISCIQHPETGRELRYGTRQPASPRQKVLVVGGGPGGLKAAAVAAERGHDVSLYEAAGQFGGQALLAQLLPSRAEFGGIATNLVREAERAGAKLHKNAPADAALIAREAPDAVILATGALPQAPQLELGEDAHVVTAWQVLQEGANIGQRVVIADWRCDWVGLGLAERLARDGCHVRLMVNGLMAGQGVPFYVRDQAVGTLHRLGVEITPYARLFGADGDSVYLQHTASGEAMVLEEVDTLVVCQPPRSNDGLAEALGDYSGPVHLVGDCLAPRTAEEAVLEGLKVASAL